MRTVILCAGDDPKTLPYYPYVAWAWNRLGWDTLLFYLGKHSELIKVYKPIKEHFEDSKNKIIPLSQVEGYTNDEVLAAARFFGGGCIPGHDLLMTAHLCLLPGEPAWNPSPDEIIVYNVKGSNQYSAPASQWRDIVGLADKMGLDLEIKKWLDAHTKTVGEPKVKVLTLVPAQLEEAARQKLYYINDNSAVALNRPFDKAEMDDLMNAFFENPPAWVEKHSHRA